jgi:hypothetical protein
MLNCVSKDLRFGHPIEQNQVSSNESSISVKNSGLTTRSKIQGNGKETPRKTKGGWSKTEEEVVSETFKKYNAENSKNPAYSSPCVSEFNSFSFTIISRYPEIVALGRSRNQIREKWINDLCPNSLGTVIEASHRQIIEDLHQEYGDRWRKISIAFAKATFLDKPERQYYSNDTIKKYCEELGQKASSQDKIKAVFIREVVGKWSKAEEGVISEAFRRYGTENPADLTHLSPCTNEHNSFSFAIVADYPEIVELGRSLNKIKEKWINDLCPSSLGNVINPSHRQIIEDLYLKYGHQWKGIARLFAKTELPDKTEEQYYSGDAIKKYCMELGLAEKSRYKPKKPERKIEKGVGKWSKAEEEVVIEAFRKYNAENPENSMSSSSWIGKRDFSAFATIADYPEVAALGRSRNQIMEKGVNQLCPNSLGTVIEASHRQIVEDLHQEHGNQWKEIETFFAEIELPNKLKGQFYYSSTIKKYCMSLEKRIRVQGESSEDTHSLLNFAGDSILEDIDVCGLTVTEDFNPDDLSW